MALLPTRLRQSNRYTPSRWVLLLTAVTACILLFTWYRSGYYSAQRLSRAGGAYAQGADHRSTSRTDAARSGLRQQATSGDNRGEGSSSGRLKVDAGLDADDWAAATRALPPRPDAHCESDVQPDADQEGQMRQLYECRRNAARAAQQRACEQPPETAVAKPFHRAHIDIGHFNAAHRSAAAADGPDSTHKLPIAVEPHGDFVSHELSGRGLWEAAEVDAILAALEAVRDETAGDPAAGDPVLVDIGANLGVYTVVAAALGYDVIAFEAMSRNVAAIHQTLCWNPELQGRVTLFPYGLGDAERSCAVLSGVANIADGHLVCSEAEWAPYKGEFQARDAVHSVRLGDYLAGVRADVVKMDVEGYEWAVMQGAGEALDGVSAALTELSRDMAKKSGREFEDVAGEYLRAWYDQGFDIRFCGAQPCGAGEALSVDDALQMAVRNGESNVLFSRRAVEGL